MLLWNMYYMQDPLRMSLEQIVYFHDYSTTIIVMVTLVVGYSIVFVLRGKGYPSRIIADHLVERTWTILPTTALILLAYPPIYLLYSIDENRVDFVCTSKAIGHQRYWSHSIDRIINHDTDSHIKADRVIRLMEVDNRAVVPSQEHVRASITSNDVLHSWAPPPLGLKIDAVPGRLNQFAFSVIINAAVHGQRPETRGVNHSFIPTASESLDVIDINYQLSSNSFNFPS